MSNKNVTYVSMDKFHDLSRPISPNCSCSVVLAFEFNKLHFSVLVLNPTEWIYFFIYFLSCLALTRI